MRVLTPPAEDIRAIGRVGYRADGTGTVVAVQDAMSIKQLSLIDLEHVTGGTAGVSPDVSAANRELVQLHNLQQKGGSPSLLGYDPGDDPM